MFSSHGITYAMCPVCQHINGVYDDTLQFSETIYSGQTSSGRTYAQNYSESDQIEYIHRKELIYIPKVQFISEILTEKPRILEIGAGSGYFCAAADDLGYDIQGLEISEEQVKFVNDMSKKKLVHHAAEDEIADYIENTDRTMLAAIGVLEHIYNMQEVLTAITKNKHIKYFYFSVPLFSLSVFFEMMFQDGFNRQLGGSHTHLFTMESIDYMNRKFGFEVEGQWIFGTDIADLYRFMRLRLQKENPDMLQYFEKHFADCLDTMQRAVDEAGFASEVHIVAKVSH